MGLLFKEGYTRGESVHVVLPADRPELPLGEEAGQRDRPNFVLDRPRIVIRLRKQSGSTTIATEEQRRSRWVRVRNPILLEQANQVLVGCHRVADMELHRLTDTHGVADRD